MKKKIVTLALVAALVAVVAVGATLAYFTDTKGATNTFTVGNVTIDLTEPRWDASGSVDADTVYPGEPLEKDPTVENTGANPCFVRIKVEGLEQFVPATAETEEQKAPWRIIYRTNWADNALGAGWVLHTDGWFYYKPTDNVLPAGIATTPLFNQIVMPKALTNGDGKGLGAEGAALKEIKVTAQAVQAQGAKSSFALVKLMTLQEIADWFTTCGMPLTVTP